LVERELFVFWQFNGDNQSFCNNTCPYCYGQDKHYRHLWNGRVDLWEQAFTRLNRDIYFVFSYGEAFGSKGFYDCVDLIGRHPNWRLCIVTNLSYDPERLILSRLGREKRVFISASWHPLGVKDRFVEWEKFKKHLLLLKAASIPVHVHYVWYKPQIQWWPQYFMWLDKNDFRASVRRVIKFSSGFKVPVVNKHVGSKFVLSDYTKVEKEYLLASTCPKVIEYGLKLSSPKGQFCSAGQDMILVKHDGDVGLCADKPDYKLGNIFDETFKLRDCLIRCPAVVCGGDYGMLHMIDRRFGDLPKQLWNDTFISQVEGIRQTSPVLYPDKPKMLRCLEAIKNQHK